MKNKTHDHAHIENVLIVLKYIYSFISKVIKDRSNYTIDFEEATYLLLMLTTMML